MIIVGNIYMIEFEKLMTLTTGFNFNNYDDTYISFIEKCNYFRHEKFHIFIRPTIFAFKTFELKLEVNIFEKYAYKASTEILDAY